MTETGARAALYLRISKDDAQTGLAVERQRSECMAIIEREKFDLVATYADSGVSAYARNVQRPAFDRMTGDYEAGKFDVVCVWDMDRFSRQPAQLEYWIGLGESRGLKIITPTETTDLGTDNGRMFARMKATIARAEVERKSARQRAQVKQAKESGTFRGRVGFNDPDVIQRIFKAVLAGEGTYRIAAALNAEGLTTITGKSWSAQAVRRVGMTPRHRGSLIREKDFDAAQAILTAGVRVGPKEKGRYSGVARCSTCGASMTASGPKYTCAWATNHPGERGHMTIARGRLDSAIDAAVLDRLTDPNFTLDDDPNAGSLGDIQSRLGAILKEKEETTANRRRYGLSWAAVAPDLERLDREEKSLTAQRDRIMEQSTQASILSGLVSDAIGGDGKRLFTMDSTQARGAVWARLVALDGDRRRELARGLLNVQIAPGQGVDRIKISEMNV